MSNCEKLDIQMAELSPMIIIDMPDSPQRNKSIHKTIKDNIPFFQDDSIGNNWYSYNHRPSVVWQMGDRKQVNICIVIYELIKTI